MGLVKYSLMLKLHLKYYMEMELWKIGSRGKQKGHEHNEARPILINIFKSLGWRVRR